MSLSPLRRIRDTPGIFPMCWPDYQPGHRAKPSFRASPPADRAPRPASPARLAPAQGTSPLPARRAPASAPPCATSTTSPGCSPRHGEATPGRPCSKATRPDGKRSDAATPRRLSRAEMGGIASGLGRHRQLGFLVLQVQPGQLCAAAGTGLVPDPLEVRIHRRRRDEELPGNVAVRLAGGDQREYL